ncbi:MAG: PilZ domain-containing protein [Methylococcaceae bacterium]|nr:PilZ domain-containing protein [Methylococcaceae bacterium]
MTTSVTYPPCDGAFSRIQALASELEKLIVKVEDPAVSKTLRNLLTDTLMQGDELGAVADALCRPGTENRRKNRIRAMGDVRLRAGNGTRELEGHCLDLSLGGVCVNLEHALEPGERWNLEIRLYGASSPMRIAGKVSWCRRHADSHDHRVGFEFQSDPELPEPND